MQQNDFINEAIEKSRQSVSSGGFPAGAVLVKDGQVIASGISIGNILHDPTSHGEVSVIREACKKLATTDLSGTVLYTSLEPCSMCLSASMWSSIPKIVFACSKELVDPAFYGGKYETEIINKTFIKPIEIVHDKTYQSMALEIINKWQK